jgi:hypothetical protein
MNFGTKWFSGEDSTIPQPATGLHGPQGVIRGRAGEGGWMGGGYLDARQLVKLTLDQRRFSRRERPVNHQPPVVIDVA